MTGFIKSSESLNSEIIVTNAAQLSGSLVSDKMYVIDGVVDMGSTQITVPQGGLSIRGVDFNISGLISSENSYTMFKDDGVFSGDLLLTMIAVSVTGTSSQVFDLDNDENQNAAEFDRVNFNDCTSLGQLDSYRQTLTTGCGFFGTLDGLTFEGTWSGGVAILTTIVRSLGSGVTLFKPGASLTFAGSVRSDLNAFSSTSIDNAAVIFGFAEANILADSGMSLNDFRVLPAVTGAVTLSGSSRKAKYRNCTGIENTHVGGVWSVSSAAETTISVINTPVKMAGTTTYTLLDHFTQSADNAIESQTTETLTMDISGSLTLVGSEGDEVSVLLRHWDDSASAYVLLETYIASFTDTTGPRLPGTQNITLLGEVVMDIGDRVEVWLENNAGTENMTAEAGSRLKLSERPS